jgi:hypothetical protein
MIEERFTYLVEMYFENSLSAEEKNELDSLLLDNKDLKEEFEEQKRMKEVLNNMKLKSPGKELWDGYWESTYNRLERGLGWLAVFIGSLILIAYASIEMVEKFYSNTTTPIVIKIGIVAVLFGVLVLLFSVIREKFFTFKNDKYKEIKR